MRRLVVASVLVLLTVGSIAVFAALDAASHSASDTLRPFVLTVGPVWVLSIWAMAVAFRRRS